jgi:hypothetical protein
MGHGFRGPCRYIKKHNVTVNRKDATILDATLDVEGEGTYVLEENKLSISDTPEPGKVYVYHSYDYPLNGDRYHGRWYNTEFPISSFQNLPATNILTYVIEMYELEEPNEDGDRITRATVRIHFTEKAARVLRGLT